MAAPKGNKFWEMRSTHGRNPIFKNPDDLWDACCQYFEYVHDTPLFEAKLTTYQGESELESIPKMQAMTIRGLCLFLDIGETTWSEYRAKEGFSGVTMRAESVIYHQKFTGAAADLLNANIIARDLGLQDKQQVDHSGSVSFESEYLKRLSRSIIDE